jgi:hypothetical protein
LQAQYSPDITDLDTICELYDVGFKREHWTPEYFKTVLSSGIFIATFSGHILLWYLHDAKALYESQQRMATVDCSLGKGNK